jgi:hypothetical protein
MSATLEQYVAQKNKWNAIFNGRQYDLKVKADRQAIANSLDADLSPENLTCDGELRGDQVRARQKHLFACVEQLIVLDPTVTFYELSI